MSSYTILYTYGGFFQQDLSLQRHPALSPPLYSTENVSVCVARTRQLIQSFHEILFLIKVTSICSWVGHTQNHESHASSGYFGRLTVIRQLSPCMPMKCPRVTRNQQLPLLVLRCPLGRMVAVLEDDLNGWLVV